MRLIFFVGISNYFKFNPWGAKVNLCLLDFWNTLDVTNRFWKVEWCSLQIIFLIKKLKKKIIIIIMITLQILKNSFIFKNAWWKIWYKHKKQCVILSDIEDWFFGNSCRTIIYYFTISLNSTFKVLGFL